MNSKLSRLAHYPHHVLAARIADEASILLWEDISVYWAIACENEDADPRLSFMALLAATSRAWNPLRLVTAAVLVNRTTLKVEDRLANHVDVLGLIEGEIAFRAALMADIRQRLVIERTILQMEKADAVDGRRDADRAFDVALVETLRNEPMRQIVEQLWAEMTSPLFISMGVMSSLFGTGDDHALQHHRGIFDALTRRDRPAAKAAMQAHLFEVRQILFHNPAITELMLRTESQ